MLLSELLGKKIVSLFDNADFGCVENLLFNDSLTQVLFIKTPVGLVPVEEIFKVCDAVVIKNQGKYNGQEVFYAYGLPLFSTSGKFLGCCDDVLLTKSFRVRNIMTAQKSYTPRAVFSAGESILIKAALPKNDAALLKLKTEGREIVYGDFAFLLGKRLSSSLFDRQGRLLASKGQKINETLLKKAKILGKLKELAVKAREM